MNSISASGHLARNQDSAFQWVTSRNQKHAKRQTNEHSSDGLMVSKISNAVDTPIPVSHYRSTNTSRFFESSIQRYPTFSMSPSQFPHCHNPAVIQYIVQDKEKAQQCYVTDNKVEIPAPARNMSVCQTRSPSSSLPQGDVMTSSPGSLHSPQQMTEEASRKRELRLLKNRLAAKAYRCRKREYVRGLEARITALKLQNKELNNIVQNLKEVCAAISI